MATVSGERVAQDPGRHGGRRRPDRRGVERRRLPARDRAAGRSCRPTARPNRAGVPALAPEALRDCYRTMLRIRALGERARALASEGEIGGYSGRARRRGGDCRRGRRRWRRRRHRPGPREAASRCTGAAVAALAAQLSATPTTSAAAASLPASRVAARAERAARRRRTGATQLPHATGIAWAMKMQAGQGGGKLALAYLDRDATSAEDFHAGLNFAGVFRVPAVFVCINDAAAGAAAASRRRCRRRWRSRRSRTASRACASTAAICSRSTRPRAPPPSARAAAAARR